MYAKTVLLLSDCKHKTAEFSNNAFISLLFHLKNGKNIVINKVKADFLFTFAHE
jgi:hypothetical protein